MLPTIIRVLPLLTTVMAATAMLADVEAAPGDPAPTAPGSSGSLRFFENEVATGKLPGAVLLIQQRGRRSISKASAFAMSRPSGR